ncbi:MAG: hypothetical protein HRT35_07300 [Algicola sp.]|nr:hypothetical protein [Algicola sp.]
MIEKYEWFMASWDDEGLEINEKLSALAGFYESLDRGAMITLKVTVDGAGAFAKVDDDVLEKEFKGLVTKISLPVPSRFHDELTAFLSKKNKRSR